jgi:hypothetical protein
LDADFEDWHGFNADGDSAIGSDCQGDPPATINRRAPDATPQGIQ